MMPYYLQATNWATQNHLLTLLKLNMEPEKEIPNLETIIETGSMLNFGRVLSIESWLFHTDP